jgi:hypothetical protein
MKRMTIDIETSGTEPGCFVYQIAALVWDGDKILDSFDERMRDDVIPYDFNEDTMKWWESVHKSVREYVQGGDSSPVHTLVALEAFLRKHEDAEVWTHSLFDIPILKQFAVINGRTLKFNFRKCYDLRTIEMLFDPDKQTYRTLRENLNNKTHNAVVDCYLQMRYVNKLVPVDKEKRIEIVDISLLDEYSDSTLPTWLMRYLSSLELLKMGQPELLRGAMYIAKQMHKDQLEDAWSSAEISALTGGHTNFEDHYNQTYNIQ